MPLSAPALLAEHHELDHFNCSEPDLADWLKQRARANHASGASRVYVCCEGNRVFGYYSISASSVIHAELPGKARRNMPNPVPVVLLGRLAVDASSEGKGLGRSLFRDAAQRINAAADTIGVSAIVVHPISEKARQFYLRLGFVDCPSEQRMMVIPMKDVRAVLGPPPATVVSE